MNLLTFFCFSFAMPQCRQRRPDWINWRKSEAREVILNDLMELRLPIEEDVMSAEEAWEEMYFPLPEFQNVVFSQFKARLKDHRKQVGRRMGANTFFLDAFRHDQQLMERGIIPGAGEHDRHGNLIFDRSAAKPLLKGDVIEEKHKEMTPEELHGSRDEYQIWPIETFRRRLRQEICTQKWLYYLEWKRAKKQLKRGQLNMDPGPDSEEEEDSDDGEDYDDFVPMEE